ncbi:hypothetical protein CDLVIII_2964 [Clostridium sp. DL-VIII]|uniref:hypothetical protein n=1 Tax=Clostridium sp. DL-VIII TaxID=641107 RepID=UPI00023AFCD3|nr:hypothetical protein [Clostridium sp. DL-VIII]EHI99554.1 hypothetical protein CDLVIII_2964 [Clostridium sp. DL-VIII]
MGILNNENFEQFEKEIRESIEKIFEENNPSIKKAEMTSDANAENNIQSVLEQVPAETKNNGVVNVLVPTTIYSNDVNINYVSYFIDFLKNNSELSETSSPEPEPTPIESSNNGPVNVLVPTIVGSNNVNVNFVSYYIKF